MCERAVEKGPYTLKFVSDHFKTQGMCEKSVEKYPLILIFVPDWFVIPGQVKVWHDHNYYCDDDEIIEWYDGYKKQKAQKAQVKKELMPIAWHPLKWWNCCVPEDGKKDRKVVGLNIDLFVPDEWIKKHFDPKRSTNKISSLLNISNGSSRPEEISLKYIECL